MGLLDDAIREHLDLKRRRGADPAEIERAEREALGPVRRGAEEAGQLEPGDDEALAYDHEGDTDWDEQFADEHELGEPHAEELVASAEEIPPAAEEIGPAPAAEEITPPAEEVGPAPAEEIAPAADPSAGLQPPATTRLEPLEPQMAPDDTGAEPSPQPAEPPPAEALHEPEELTAPDAGVQTEEYDVGEDGGDDERLWEDAAPEGDAPSREPEHYGGPPTREEQSGDDQPGDEDMLEETPEFLQDTPDHDRLWFEQRPPRDFDFDG
jgi:hypothetical protein